MAKVRNLNGLSTSVLPSGYQSLKEYWENTAGRKFSKCACLDCDNNAIVAAYVQRSGKLDTRWYVIPLCGQCSVQKKNSAFTVRDSEMIWNRRR